jgi:toxin FitB
MRYLLDTNILSNITKASPSESLLAWMAEQNDDDLFISSLTVAEIRRGVLEKPVGKRRDQLEACLAGRQDRRHCSPAACSRSTRQPR